jgi:hypothetical protein
MLEVQTHQVGEEVEETTKEKQLLLFNTITITL